MPSGEPSTLIARAEGEIESLSKISVFTLQPKNSKIKPTSTPFKTKCVKECDHWIRSKWVFDRFTFNDSFLVQVQSKVNRKQCYDYRNFLFDFFSAVLIPTLLCEFKLNSIDRLRRRHILQPATM